MDVGVDYHFTQSSLGAGLDQKAATLHAQDVTAVALNYASDIDKASTDTVSLSSDLSGVTGGTASTQLTSSLAKILQRATSVDSATGAREINAGVGQALGTQLGELFTQSGFSQADADAASQSLVKQFSFPSHGSSGIAVSLAISSKTAGGYTGALSGGEEVSSWSAQSTATLSISFDPAAGNLSVTLDQHVISASRTDWGSAALGSVSIVLNQAELQPYDSTPAGTTTGQTGSPIQESQTTTYGASHPNTALAVSNVVEPSQGTSSDGQLASLNALLSWQQSVWQATSSDTASATSNSGISSAEAASTPATARNKAAQNAVTILKAVLKQLHDATTASSVSLKSTTNVGTLVASSDGSKSLTYNRPSGDLGLVALPNVSLSA